MPTTIIVNHGTSWANAKSIAQHGFSPSREEGSYLGAGVYAANEAKATRFAHDAARHGGEGGGALITMRVTVPDVKTVYEKTSGTEHKGSQALFYQPGYNSDPANNARASEFVFREGAQIEVLNIKKV